MTRVHNLQVSMTRGEVTPLVRTRVDIEDYKLGLAECTNWMVLKYGGLFRFPGTTWLENLLGASVPSGYEARLLPFVFSEDEAYVFCFTDARLMVFDAVLGEFVMDGADPLVVVSPYDEDDLPNLQIEGLGDVTYVACKGHPPRQIIRYSATDWQFVDYEPVKGPWLPQPPAGSAALLIGGEQNAIPAMTSNTAPSGTVTGFGPDNVSLFRVFDQVKHVSYAPSTLEDIEVTYDMGVGDGFALIGYSMTAYTDRQVAYKTPISWQVYGQLDGETAWELLDEHQQTNDWVAGEVRVFEVNNSKVYRKYRFLFKPGEAAATGGTDTVHQLPTVNLLADPSDQAEMTLTATSTVGINDGNGFLSSDIGRQIRIMGDDGFWRAVKITSRTSTTVVGCKLLGPAPFPRAYNDEDLGTTLWQMQAWGETPGHPRAVTRHMGRVGWLGTPTEPRTTWLSRSSDFDHFGTSQPLLDDDAVTFTLVNGRQDEILWASSNGQDLLLGTIGGIRVIQKRTQEEVFGPANVEEAGATTIRACAVQPIWVGSIMVFADKFRTRLHETAFSLEEGTYAVQELSMLAEHLFRDGIKEMHYQIAPSNIIWVVLQTGDLIACTYDRQQRVFGVSRVIIPTHGNVSAVKVISACAVPAGRGDGVFLALERTVSGVKQIDFEVVNPMPILTTQSDGAGSESAACLVSSQVFGEAGGADLTSVTILDHLVGSEVAVYDLENDVLLGKVTPNTTTLDLTQFGSSAHVQIGVPFLSRLEMLRPPNMPEDGGYFGRPLVPNEIWVDVMESRGLRAGGDLNTQDLLPEGDRQTNPDTPVKYTGRLFVPLDERTDVEGAGVVVETDSPYPATIRGMMATFDRGS